MPSLLRMVLIPAVLAASALAGIEPAAAGPAPPTASAPVPPLEVPTLPAGTPFRLQILAESSWDAGFDGADVSWLRTGARLGVGGPVSERVDVNLQMHGEAIQFDVDGDENFLDAGRPGVPFDDLIRSGARLGVAFHVYENWLLVGESYLQLNFERGAHWADALEGGVLLGAGYRSAELEALLGVKLASRLDRNGLSVQPTLRLRWLIDDRWRLAFNNGDVHVERVFSEQWTISLAAAYQADRFRLSDRDDGPGGVGNGSLAHRRVPVTLGVEWRPGSHWRVQLRGGAVAWQRFKVDDEDANGFDAATSDRAAPFASLDITANF